MLEFYRMCDQFGWETDDEEKEKARESLKDAMTLQFNSIYGVDVDDISSWQSLCEALGIVPIPKKLETCRNVSTLRPWALIQS